MADRTNFNGWEKLDSRGKGGQGEVFRVRKGGDSPAVSVDRGMDAIRGCAAYASRPDRETAGREFVSFIRDIVREVAAGDRAPLGALKMLHTIEDQSASEKAGGRMAQEVAALNRFQHPSLVRILEAKPDERWFVMEYFDRGTLHGHLTRFRGDVLSSLRAFRPLLEAVAELHKGGYVHRDIKPANVFIADDGHLVLGDFGLVINPGAADPRLTDTYENVGSRDWMPGWAMGVRMDDVKPNFDVFSLGKLLWSMVSGKPFLRLWYFLEPEFDLERMFASEPAVRWATRIFRKCIVEREADCLNDAGELLMLVDETIGALRIGGQVLRKKDGFHLRCNVCGLGSFYVKIPYGGEDMVVFCDNCGHGFSFRGVKEKVGWE